MSQQINLSWFSYGGFAVDNEFSLTFTLTAMDSDNNPITLEPDKIVSILVSSIGGTFSYNESVPGNEYTLKAPARTGKDIPADLREVVRISSNSEDYEINQTQDTYVYYPPNPITLKLYPEDKKGIIYEWGGATKFSFNKDGIAIGKPAVIDTHDQSKTINANIIANLPGETTFDIEYTCVNASNMMDSTYVYGNTVSVVVPTPRVIDTTDNSANIVISDYHEGAIKFRYGVSEYFDPTNTTTYIEILVESSTFVISDLDPNTEYSCQAVFYTGNGNYYNSDIIKFRTSGGGGSSSGIIFDNGDLLEVFTSLDARDELSGIHINKKSPDNTVDWSINSPLNASCGVTDDGSLTLKVTWTDKIYRINKNSSLSAISITAIERDSQGRSVGRYNSHVKVKIIYIVNTVDLICDSRGIVSKYVDLNSDLKYTSISNKNKEYYNIITELDNNSYIESILIEPKKVFDGSKSEIFSVIYNNKEYTFNLNINIMAQINFPPAEGILAENVKVFNSPSEMFHSYPGVEYAVMEENDVKYYLFKTGTVESTNSSSSDAEEWTYDICVLTPEVIAKGVSTDNSDSDSGN